MKSKNPTLNTVVNNIDPNQAKMVRSLARALWLQDYKKENPISDPATRQAAWSASKLEYIQKCKAATRQLGKKNIILVSKST